MHWLAARRGLRPDLGLCRPGPGNHPYQQTTPTGSGTPWGISSCAYEERQRPHDYCRRLYPGRIWAYHGGNEAGQRGPDGEVYPKRFRGLKRIREKIRETVWGKGMEKA